MASRSASNNNNNRAELLLVIEPKQGEEKKKVQKYYVTVPVKESSIKKISGFDECFLVEKERKEAIVAENGYFLLKDYVGKQYIIYGRKWREDSFEDVRENESSENQSQKDEELEEYEFVKNNVRECENGNIWTHSYYYVWDKASIIASNLPTLSEISALTGVPFDDVLSLQFAPSDLTSALMDYWNGSQESEEEKLTKELERIVTLDNLLEKNLREGQPQIKDLTSIKIWEVTKSIQNLISEEKEFFGINKEFNTCLNQSFEFAKNKGPNSEVRCVIEIAYSLSLSLTNPMDTFSSDLSSSSLASPSSAQYRSVIQFLQQKLSYIHTITSENFFPVSEPSNSNSIQSLLKKYSTSIINELLPYFEAKYGESLKNEKSDILSRLRESKQQNEDQKRILEEFKMKINNLQDQINSIENQKSNLKFEQDTLHKRLQEMEKEKLKLRNDLENKTKDSIEFAQRNQILEADIQKTRHDISEMEKEQEKLKQEKEQLLSEKEEQAKRQNELVQTPECAICFEEIETRFACTPCGHSYCSDCAHEAESNERCHLCRERVSGIFRVYL